jgi:hypothetical protein
MGKATDPASKGGQPPSQEACPQPDPSNDPVQDTRPKGADDNSILQAAVEDALAEGKTFAVSEGNYKERLAVLAPKLLRVRQEIHQRQEGYQKGRRNGAPNWGKWLKFWRAETGVRLSDKTIKKVLDEIDESKPAPREKKPRVKTITPAEARKMGLALLAVLEMLSNVDDKGKVTLGPDDIAPILEMAPSPEQLNRLLESLRQEAEAAEPSQAASAAASGPAETAGTSPVKPSSKRPTLRTGNADDLPDKIIEKCAPDFEAIPTDLPPSKCVDIIYDAAKEFAKQFRGPGIGGFSIKVSHIPPKRVVSAEPTPSQDKDQPSLFDMSLPGFKVA